jgi:hypothetical protein
VFCAAGLVLTHFHIGTLRLFDDLSPSRADDDDPADRSDAGKG